MLILQRNTGESVAVRDASGNLVGTIKLLSKHRGVKLGFEFDRSYRFLRSEKPLHDVTVTTEQEQGDAAS